MILYLGLERPMILYLAKLHAEADGGYSVEIVDLPGCFTEGNNLAEAVRNAEEAILCHLDGMIADGRAHPRPGCGRPDPPSSRGRSWWASRSILDKLAISNKTRPAERDDPAARACR